MAETIEFRIALSTARDWDPPVRSFRCAAVGIPGSRVTAIHAGGMEIPPSSYRASPSGREIQFTGQDEPPGEVLVTIAVSPTLTTRSSAVSWTAIAGVLTALITMVGGYYTAVEPARIEARMTQVKLNAEVDAQTKELADCKDELQAGKTLRQDLDACEEKRDQAQTKLRQIQQETHGEESSNVVVVGRGSVNINNRSEP